MERLKLSRHLIEERCDRVAYILQKTGLGNVVYTAPLEKGRTAYITDEGVAYFKGQDGTISEKRLHLLLLLSGDVPYESHQCQESPLICTICRTK